MGGGGVMRAAAKVAGIGSMAGGALRGGGVSADSLLSRSSAAFQQVAEQSGGLKVEQGGQKSAWEVDDWEFAGGVEVDDAVVVDRNSAVSPRMVFGPVPTEEEAREATSELKEVLEKVYVSSPQSPGSVNSLSSHQGTQVCITHESAVSNSAFKAFKFLQECPTAQTVVADIARDPNVWNAVMQNQSVLKLFEMEKMDGEFKAPESPANSSVNSSDDEQLKKPEGLMAIIEGMKLSVLDMVNNLSNIVQSWFAPPDAGKNPESSESASRMIATGGTVMGLVVMVIMVVVMKRA